LGEKAARNIGHAYQSVEKKELRNGHNRRLQAISLARKTDILLISQSVFGPGCDAPSVVVADQSLDNMRLSL
jgi:hypothetical protein